ncbi:MAG TPA: alpha/beta fold hydrolase BchO [Erythrobacter sp.]|nr:alpha/beta fold hydrolase BchO [Erythrobacter sp.]
MSRTMRWDSEGRDWPHRAHSRFIRAGGLTWHVQQMGDGPALLLLHGTGASTHSWHRVMPLLAQRFTVIAPDLPLHAFTGGEPVSARASLPAMAHAVAALIEATGIRPAALVGHSAGAAIALQAVLQGAVGQQTRVIGFNPALMPFPGAAAQIFPGMAKMLLLNPLVPRVFAGVAKFAGDPARFLERSTGSRTDPVSLACYGKLFANHHHCRGALAMMAHWDLERFSRRLGDIASPVLLVHSRGDLAVPMDSVEAATARIPGTRLELMGDLGHLAHEEAPELAAGLIADFIR